MKTFYTRQLYDIQQEGIRALLRKARKLIMIPIVLPVVIVIRFVKKFFLIRFGIIHNQRIGHFLINTELYLCEQDSGLYVPADHYVDIFGIGEKTCNNQLLLMWKRIMNIWPLWIINPIMIVNRVLPFGDAHEIPHQLVASGTPRDINNLLDVMEKHLYFTDDEHTTGEKYLREMGIPEGALFVCLIVRDSSYLTSRFPKIDWSYQDYRDNSDIENYVLAAEELAERGYYVIRMGASVQKALPSLHTKVIDYAFNGMRTDFMDIYLGANCEFTISNGTGWDHVPNIFRRPMVYVNFNPPGRLNTWSKNYLSITSHHWSTKKHRELTLREVFAEGVGYSLRNFKEEYEAKDIELKQNTPEEIRDVCVEKADRLNGVWQSHKDDDELQKRFWEIFPKDAKWNGIPLNGEIRSRFGSDFLRNNRWWLQ